MTGFIIAAVNAVIAALAAAAQAVLNVLPAMPALPSMPQQVTDALGWVNWFFPVGTVFDILGFMVSAWLLWTGVATILRWAKVVQ